MKNRPLLLLIAFLLICFAFSMNCKAQTSIKRMNVYVVVADGDTTMLPGDTAFKANTPLTGTMNIFLSDTNYSYIHVKLGSADGDSDIYSGTFDKTPVVLNSGNLLAPKGYKIVLDLGSFTGLNTFYSEAYLEDSNNNIIGSVAKYSIK